MATSPGRCPARRRQPGFSLIELLICLAIVGLLVGLMLPGVGHARERARSAVCMSRLRGLQIATFTYADMYRVQPATYINGVVQELDLPGSAWRCPTHRVMQGWEQGSSYTYLAPLYMVDPPGSGFQLRSLKPWLAMRAYEQNVYLPLFWDTEARHEGDYNVVYWDGRAERRNW
jgi:prepilin-type N-terminal cleavage/methylation domain-containing protein/prepilin-type processing-associated H-X9-DG protein